MANTQVYCVCGLGHIEDLPHYLLYCLLDDAPRKIFLLHVINIFLMMLKNTFPISRICLLIKQQYSPWQQRQLGPN